MPRPRPVKAESLGLVARYQHIFLSSWGVFKSESIARKAVLFEAVPVISTRWQPKPPGCYQPNPKTHAVCVCVCVCVCVRVRVRACVCVRVRDRSLSRVPLLATPWTVAHQAPLSVGFPRQEFWECVVISFSRGSFRPRDGTHISCIGKQVLYH